MSCTDCAKFKRQFHYASDEMRREARKFLRMHTPAMEQRVREAKALRTEALANLNQHLGECESSD